MEVLKEMGHGFLSFITNYTLNVYIKMMVSDIVPNGDGIVDEPPHEEKDSSWYLNFLEFCPRKILSSMSHLSSTLRA